jgi:HK97 family phage prohead protease
MKEKLIIGNAHVVKTSERKEIDAEGEDVLIGIVEGYLATWDTDRANDRFIKGAFADSIADLIQRKRPLRLKRQHYNLIGGFDPEKLTEDDIGLYGVAELNLGVQEAREAYMLARQGVLSDFSVGFSADPMDVDIVEGVRVFKKAKLWETSLVDEPMNARAVVTAVRSVEEIETFEEAVIACAKHAQVIGAFGVEACKEQTERINARFHDVVKRDSPLEKGVWSPNELRALPKSLRRYILSHEKLSRESLEALLDAFPEPNGGQSSPDDANREPTEDDKAISEIATLLKGAWNG